MPSFQMQTNAPPVCAEVGLPKKIKKQKFKITLVDIAVVTMAGSVLAFCLYLLIDEIFLREPPRKEVVLECNKRTRWEKNWRKDKSEGDDECKPIKHEQCDGCNCCWGLHSKRLKQVQLSTKTATQAFWVGQPWDGNHPIVWSHALGKDEHATSDPFRFLHASVHGAGKSVIFYDIRGHGKLAGCDCKEGTCKECQAAPKNTDQDDQSNGERGRKKINCEACQMAENSTDRGDQFTWESLSEDMVKVAETLVADSHFVAGGRSMGGALALWAAILEPTRVEGVIFWQVPKIWEERRLSRNQFWEEAKQLKKKNDPFWKVVHGDGMSDLPSVKDVVTIECPVLIIFAEGDDEHPRSSAEQLQRAIGDNAELVEIETARKWPWEESAQSHAVEEIQQFMKKHALRPGGVIST